MNEQYIIDNEVQPKKRFPLWIILTAAALIFVILAAGVYFFFSDPRKSDEENGNDIKSTAQLPDDIYAVRLSISGKSEDDINDYLFFCSINGYNTVFIEYSQGEDEMLGKTIEYAYAKGLSPYVIFNISQNAVSDYANMYDLQKAGQQLREISKNTSIKGFLFEGWQLYISDGGVFTGNQASYYINDLCNAVRSLNPELCIGIALPGSPEDNPVPLAWVKNNMFDFAMVSSGGYVSSDTNTFGEDLSRWKNILGDCNYVVNLNSALAGSGFTGWERDDQLLQQIMELDDGETVRFCMNSIDDIILREESTQAVYKYLSGLIDDKYIIKDLSFTAPANKNYTTYSSKVVFSGASDPEFPLTVNGKTVERDDMGYFEMDMELELGVNTFVFSHNGLETSFNITYKTVIIASVLPDSTQLFDSGSSLTVTAVARTGSVVKASIGGKTVTLKQTSFYGESVDSFGEFYNFSGTIQLPIVSSDTNLGNIVFTASWKDLSETKKGGVIGVYKREQTVDSNFTLPVDDGYINVGSTYIAEVITDRAETFSTSTLNDFSQPVNAYLPKGTVDYCKSTVDSLFTDSGEKLTYRTLRYGKRVYTASNNNGNEIKVYKGTLPATNSVTVSEIKETVRNTTLALNVDWKAPFKFEMEPQKYIDDSNGEARPYYTVNSITYTYVDITFCYANKVEGDVSFSANHPLFKRAEWIKNKADCTLRLYLREKGSLYGWSAEYDSRGRLVFTFLHPVQLEKADNIYGVSLESAVILLDPGHGGKDIGAVHNQYSSTNAYSTTEAMANLNMALEMKRQLEALGATVYMTRSNNSTYLSLADRTKIIADIQPDIFISVHHNWNKYSSPNGFESYYFTPMSWRLADEIYDATKAIGMYSSMRGNMWHTFFVMRVTDCPSVLTENGFISSNSDYKNIITNASGNQKRSAAAVKGIVEYFKSIQPDTPYTPPSSEADDIPVNSELAALPPDEDI